MCSGTLGHIARYHSKTSNNNKSFIVVLFHMSSSYLACISCHALLLSITSFSLFMIPMPLGYLLLLYYVLTPWICIFRFRGLERSGTFYRGPGLSRRAGWPALDLSCPTLLLVHGSPSLREHFCIFDCISFFLDLGVIRTLVKWYCLS